MLYVAQRVSPLRFVCPLDDAAVLPCEADEAFVSLTIEPGYSWWLNSLARSNGLTQVDAERFCNSSVTNLNPGDIQSIRTMRICSYCCLRPSVRELEREGQRRVVWNVYCRESDTSAHVRTGV